MCGIVGFVKTGNSEQLRKKLSDGLLSIGHRGPDGRGTYVDGSVHLGHSQLHILDRTNASNQPYTSTEGRFVLTYNGEVYNYLDIRKTLQKHGFVFKTEGDTEVVLYAYKHWGKDCVKHFSGMFAFCIYDRQEQTFFLARDIFGEKPLYYSLTDGFSFCSELNAFQIINGGVSISLSALNQFLAIGYVLHPLSLFEGVSMLPPASTLTYRIDNGVCAIERYFDYASCFEKKHSLSEQDIVDQTRILLSESINERISGEFPFGVFLSGGLDSSSIAAHLKQQGHQFPCFNVAFTNSVYDESNKASFVAEFLDQRLKTVDLNSIPLLELDNYLNIIDYPTFDNSSFAMYRLAQLAKQEVQYVLTGDGADEIFGGYATYRANRLQETIGPIIIKLNSFGLRSVAKHLFRNKNDKAGLNTKISRFLNGLHSDHRRSHFNWRGLFSIEERIGLLGREHSELIFETDPFHQFKAYYDRVGHLSKTDQHLYVDSQTWLTDNVLIKTDRNTMLFGLEARSPFLDRALSTFIASCPATFKQNKTLLKKAMKGLLPSQIVDQTKSGFNAPVANWFDMPTDQDEFKYYTRYIFEHKFQQS